MSAWIQEIDPTTAGPRALGSRSYIAVAGNIGAGKSSLVEFLCRRFSIDPYFEPNEQNPYLADFYDDMRRWSFSSQTYFLAAKYALHRAIQASPRSVIQDRTIWEDAEIFARNLYRTGLMDERDWRTYEMIYDAIRAQLEPPDLLVYLRCPVPIVRERIRLRGRAMESAIPLAYLKRLDALYEEWIARYDLSPVLVLSTDKLDYLTDLVDQHDVLATIERYIVPQTALL